MGIIDRIDRWATTPPFPAHRGTTKALRAVQPMTATHLGSRGAYVGINLADGTAFCFDPWELYGVALHDANMFLLGDLGYGKSALVKALCYRWQPFGHRAVFISPKPAEYDALAEACGITPIRLTPGGRLRLNPLDTADVADVVDARTQRMDLLTRLGEAALGRPAGAAERNAIAVALDQADDDSDGVVVLPQVVELMLDPTSAMADRSYTTAAALRVEARDIGLALHELVSGRLAGMFDAPTSPEIDLTADAVVLDLSALQTASVQAMGMALTCLSATLTGQLAAAADVGRKTLLVMEESWAALRDVAMARYFRTQTKLSRAIGLGNVFVLHKLSDLDALGDSGSEQVQIARNLVADCGTKVIYHQAPGELDRLVTEMQLTSTQRAMIAELSRGQALWLVGSSRNAARVQLDLTAWERDVLTYTDQAMTSPGPRTAPAERRDTPWSTYAADRGGATNGSTDAEVRSGS